MTGIKFLICNAQEIGRRENGLRKTMPIKLFVTSLDPRFCSRQLVAICVSDFSSPQFFTQKQSTKRADKVGFYICYAKYKSKKHGTQPKHLKTLGSGTCNGSDTI